MSRHGRRRPDPVKRLVAIACLGLAAAGLCARLSSAAFTATTSIASSPVTVDKLANYFSATPLNGTVASGGVDNLALDFGTVASARTFTSVFRVTNVSGASRTAVLTVSGIPSQTSAVAFSGGGTSATLAAGASATVNVTTSSTVAGRGSGTLRLGLSGLGWMYRDYSVKIDEAPEAPTAPAVAQKPGGRLDLSWTASTTTTNLAGYDVYRSNGGGAYSKLNPTPLTGTTYSDTATTDGTTYTYKLTAVSSGSPLLTSVDSPTVTATADATPPGAPTALSLANGGGAGNAYVNAGNASSISVSVSLAANSLTSDTVKLTVSNGGNSVTTTHAGANGAGPAAPSASYTDNSNANADVVFGSAEANASIGVTSASGGTYSTTANGSGAYSVNVAAAPGKPNGPIALTYTVTATDAAGNTSAATTLNVNDTK
ncbi:MAG: hypothetical protein AUG91_09205 [Actinobacteria bacterium 13_1_20CM_4_69_9]|nr:MAG: hypothetical protein AUG91_09205 [Actinobacteria bacterium 13_1_20CM_4_69_9]